MWVFWLNSSCHLGILNTASVITAKAEHIGHFVMTEGRIGEKSKADGKGGLMGTASFRAPWLFLSKWKKYKCGVSKSAQQVRAAVTRAVPSPRCSAKGEGLGHLLAAWRRYTHQPLHPRVAAGPRRQQGPRMCSSSAQGRSATLGPYSQSEHGAMANHPRGFQRLGLALRLPWTHPTLCVKAESSTPRITLY